MPRKPNRTQTITSYSKESMKQTLSLMTEPVRAVHTHITSATNAHGIYTVRQDNEAKKTVNI